MVNKLYRNVLFSWAEEKYSINIRKHGFKFEDVLEVFFDPFYVLEDATDGDEQRDALIGYAEDGQMLYVVHLEHENGEIRIISARKAVKAERRRYE